MTVFWGKNARRCNKPEQHFNQCTMKLSFKLVVVLNLQSSSSGASGSGVVRSCQAVWCWCGLVLPSTGQRQPLCHCSRTIGWQSWWCLPVCQCLQICDSNIVINQQQPETIKMPEVDPTMGEPEKPPSRIEQIKYYTSLFLGALAIVCVFGFLFLVPFVLDPAISTMMHQFVTKPVHCKVIIHVFHPRKWVQNLNLGDRLQPEIWEE